MPKYSVIVPTYNVENYIEKCLNSILNQDFDDYEIIVVNDGSTDNSGVIAEQIAKQHSDKINLIAQENKGLGGARNAGIDAAKGEYFLFIDSDDTIVPDTLSSINSYIEKHNVKMVFFDYEDVDENENMLSYVTAYHTPDIVTTLEETPNILLMANSACNKVYHRSIFDDSGIRFPDRAWYEDLNTVVKLYPFAGKIGYLKRSLYHYFQRGGSIMNNKNTARNREIIDAIDSAVQFYKEKGLYEKYRDELEYLAVFHIYILTTVRVLKVDRKAPVLKELKNYILSTFPNYKNNKYCVQMSKKEKLIMKLADANCYLLLKLLLDVNSKLK